MLAGTSAAAASQSPSGVGGLLVYDESNLTSPGGVQMSRLVAVSLPASLLAGTRQLASVPRSHSPYGLLPRAELTAEGRQGLIRTARRGKRQCRETGLGLAYRVVWRFQRFEQQGTVGIRRSHSGCPTSRLAAKTWSEGRCSDPANGRDSEILEDKASDDLEVRLLAGRAGIGKLETPDYVIRFNDGQA